MSYETINISFKANHQTTKIGWSYLSGSESSVNRLITSPSGGAELLLDEGAPEVPSRDSFEGNSCSSCSVMGPGTGGSSVCFWLFFFFRLRREARSFEKPLEPALAESDTSPAWVLGLSEVDSIDERPLLRPELSIGSDSADTVQARRDRLLLPLRLEDEESAMASAGISAEWAM